VPLIVILLLRSVILLVTGCVLAGCHSQPTVTPAALVGSYIYVSKDPASKATDHSFDHLVLRADGTYDLVEGGTTKAVSKKKGVWRIEPGTPSDHVDVVLDNSGYPVEIKRNEVRLLADEDVGIWWVKAL
jgi:hypothetical protein